MNKAIDPEVCSVSYISFDMVMKWMHRFGRGALMAKTDIEESFHLLPIHLGNMRLLGGGQGEFLLTAVCPWHVLDLARCSRHLAYSLSGWCRKLLVLIRSSITWMTFFVLYLLGAAVAYPY